jgi:energy-converting hydrogenase Eha subunit F
MRYRHESWFSTDTQYMLQKRILQPYAVVSGYQIYKDTLHKKYCFYTDELGRVERGLGHYARLLNDLAYYIGADIDDAPGDYIDDQPSS